MTSSSEPFYLQKGNIYAVPIIHYNMEMAAQVRLAFEAVSPDCVAVELAETMQLQLLHAASRLPDISLVITYNQEHAPIYYMCEPCDAAFEALRSALERGLPAYCIDLDVENYPELKELLPDPYAIQRIGLKNYYETYKKVVEKQNQFKSNLDVKRETTMARRLKELSLSYDRILFVGGMSHVEDVLKLTDQNSFPKYEHVNREVVELCTLTEESCRDVMAEFGWITQHYEKMRNQHINDRAATSETYPPDRQKLIYQLYKESSEIYQKNTGNSFAVYHMRNTMKFVRNYALATSHLMPDLFQILTAAKGCVDHNFAYEVWLLATAYPHLSNIDNLPELDLSIEDIWGHSKIIRFQMREPTRKNQLYKRRRKDHSNIRFDPPGPFSICSYPPEDVIVENFGDFLKKKGTQLLAEEGARTVPFTTSLEDGIDTRETIRHWYERKLYVKAIGKPLGGVGSVVIIFDSDIVEGKENTEEKYPWKTTWLGEHDQESDMAFYGTDVKRNIVGPGISRCEYGGFMMSYPPRRMWDVWNDPDYESCRSKPEVLLMAAIDYAVKPVVVYVASDPPKSSLKSFAARYGKKIVYIPIGQLSPITINRLRVFHVLDGHEKRGIADEYIF